MTIKEMSDEKNFQQVMSRIRIQKIPMAISATCFLAGLVWIVRWGLWRELWMVPISLALVQMEALYYRMAWPVVESFKEKLFAKGRSHCGVGLEFLCWFLDMILYWAVVTFEITQIWKFSDPDHPALPLLVAWCVAIACPAPSYMYIEGDDSAKMYPRRFCEGMLLIMFALSFFPSAFDCATPYVILASLPLCFVTRLLVDARGEWKRAKGRVEELRNGAKSQAAPESPIMPLRRARRHAERNGGRRWGR